MNHVSTDAARNAAQGRWPSILAVLAPELGQALQRPGRHVPCPGHGGKDGFRVFRDVDQTGGGICNTCGEFADGFALLMWANGWSFIEAKDAVVDYLGLEPGNDRLPPPRRRQQPLVQEQSEEETRSRVDKLAAVRKGTTADTGLIANYCKSRGLFLPPPESLRLHPALPYYDDERQLLGTFPAMIARVELPDGTGITLHRTWLASDGSGKAPVPTAKKLMTAIRDGATLGAAIHLTGPGETLGLAEGIETALAVREACRLEEFDLPMWATVTAGGMEAVQIPDTVRRVEIWADHDVSGRGQEAAEILAQRMHEAGKQVYVLLPPVGKDWLDVLNEQGHKAICAARTHGTRWAPPAAEEPERLAQEQPARRSARLLTVAELKRLPPPQYLVHGYVVKNGLIVHYGPSGGGKSFVAVGMALSVASGRAWLDKPVHQGPVVYVAGEGVDGYSKRVIAWELDRNVKSADGFPIRFRDMAVNLMEHSAVLGFIEEIQHLKPALVIFDTLARMMAGGDENSSRDIGIVVRHCDLIRDTLHCAVMLVHHTSKGGTSERGSSALRGAADAMISLIPEDELLTLAVDKLKDGAAPEPMRLRRVPVLHADSCVIGQAQFTAGDGKMTLEQRKALKMISMMPGWTSRKDWQEMTELKLGPFMAVVNALLIKDLVERQDDKPNRYRITPDGFRAM